MMSFEANVENVNGAGQVENIGAHSKDLTSAKERRTRSSGAFGQSPSRPCLLVSAPSQATAQSSNLRTGKEQVKEA